MKFKSLKVRIAVIFLSLILGIQLLGALAIRYNITTNARASVQQQLAIGEKVFINLLNHGIDNLSQSAKVLAIDYGFRQAIASADDETILSAISNHQERIGADIAFFYEENTHKFLQSGNINPNEARPVIEHLIQIGANQSSSAGYTIFNEHSYQLVAVPVKAPLTIGWIIMGFEINNNLVKKLNTLSNLEVTFISRSRQGHWLSRASTMPKDTVIEITQQTPALLSANQPYSEMPIVAYGANGQELKDTFGTRYVKIFDNSTQALYAVLQQSIGKASAPYLSLQFNLLILTIVGAFVFVVTIIKVSKHISQPISELANNAKKLEQGQYDMHIYSDREDEIGRLSNAFNSMSAAIAMREQSIRKLAFNDELTGLPNRAYFLLELENNVLKAQKNQQSLSVMIMDLNRFKQINNILGQSNGDKILRSVGQRLNVFSRNHCEVLARFGGDEFAILMSNADAKQAQDMAEPLLKMLDVPIAINDEFVDMSAGVGIASYPQHGDSAELLISRAEIAMYVAKAKQLGSVVFDNRYDVGSEDNLNLATEIKAAINENQLKLYLQPKIDLATRQITSAEALVRWLHPTRGMVFPDQFIPFAEQTGYIHAISLWMLNEACRVNAEFKKNGLSIAIAVNLSARDLIDQSLPTQISSILHKHGLDEQSLSLEITESSIMEDPLRAQQTLDYFDEMGIQLAIDDFGTGYSSLAYLKRLPVSELKIDKSFVLNMQQDENDSIIVQSTIALGHSLGLKVVAEGIENQVVWEMLCSMQCDYGQGYLMARPMPAAEFLAWSQNWQQS